MTCIFLPRDKIMIKHVKTAADTNRSDPFNFWPFFGRLRLKKRSQKPNKAVILGKKVYTVIALPTKSEVDGQ